MKIITTELVAKTFGHCWPHYCKDDAQIELLKFWHGGDKHTAPFNAAVRWDGSAKRWHILANLDDSPEMLWKRLWHELGHVRFGDLAKSAGGRKHIDLLRKAATGCLTSGGDAAAVKSSVGDSWATRTARTRETIANNWAERMAAKWWPVVGSLDYKSSDATVEFIVKGYAKIKGV